MLLRTVPSKIEVAIDARWSVKERLEMHVKTATVLFAAVSRPLSSRAGCMDQRRLLLQAITT